MSAAGGDDALVSSESIGRWGEQPPPEDEALADALHVDDATTTTPYPVNEELNFKVARGPRGTKDEMGGWRALEGQATIRPCGGGAAWA